MQPRPRQSRWQQNSAPTARAAGEGRAHHPDRWLVILPALLLAIGLIVVYSISPGLSANQGLSQGHFVTKQVLAVGLSILTFLVASRLPTSWWSKASNWLSGIAALACIAVLVVPINPSYPAHRWVRLGTFSFQVAELIKLALIIAIAKFLTDRWKAGQLHIDKKTLYPLAGVLGVLGFVVAKLQSDFGSAAVMLAMVFVAAVIIGMPLKKVAAVAGIIIVLAGVAISTSAYRRDRVTTFLHPGSDCSGSGYQACQALISVGSGGLVGLGLGYSVQAYGYLPEPSNDSIFAIIAEKFGFIGSLIVLAIYGGLIDRLRRIAQRSADQFSRLVVVGVMAWISTQMIINVGAMIGLLPLKGITLPFISQGGTSIVFLAAALGLVFQISRYTSYQDIEPSGNYEQTNKPTYNNDGGRRERRAHNSITFTRPRD